MIIDFFKRARARGNEHEQSLLRVTITSAIIIYMYLSLSPDQNLFTEFILIWLFVYLIFSAYITYHTFLKPNFSGKRQFMTMLGDIGTISFSMFLTQEQGVLLFWIYLWIIIGNGTRYGPRALGNTQITSILGFLAVALFNDYWQSHSVLSFGLLLTLIPAPLYLLRLVTRLNQAIQSAEQANKAKSQFLAHMSHEMRTPLNGMIGASDMMLATQLNAEQKELAHMMRDSGQLLLQRINEVLDLSRVESGKMVAELIEFDLRDMVRRTVNLFTPLATKKDLRLHTDISSETHTSLLGDVQHLQQVIINLVANALKFTDRGSVELRIHTISQDEASVQLRFEIIDTGIGIAQDAQQAIFESFTQANAGISRKYGGTGLGTTISKQLVRFMGGQIGVQSELGKGSVFWFELPFKKGQSITLPPALPTENPTALAPLLAGENMGRDSLANTSAKKIDSVYCPPTDGTQILIADDNATNRRIITRILERAGYQVDAAEDGESALDFLENKQYALAVLDMQMPGLDGLEVVKMYRTIHRHAAPMPIVMLTANITPEARLEATDMAVDAFLTKPIDAPILLATVAQLTATTAQPRQPMLSSASAMGIAMSSTDHESSSPNLAMLRRLESLNNGDNFVNVIIHEYIEESERMLTSMQALLHDRKFMAFREQIHALKSGAHNVGAEHLVKICQDIALLSPTELQATAHDWFQQICATNHASCLMLKQYLSSPDRADVPRENNRT
ncbi:MAG: ATP-binding protein [Candidatus Nitrotoga sp.]